MIKFRQKDFSKLLTSAIYQTRVAGDSIVGGIKKGIESLGRRNYQGRVTPSTNISSTTSTYRVNRIGNARKAIKDTKAIENLPQNTANSLNRVALDPGHAINQAAETALKNPITTTTGIAGKVMMVTPGVPAPARMSPIGGVGMVAERGLKKVSPGYRRATEKIAAGYRSTISPKVRNVVNNTVEALKQQPMFM